MRRTLLFALALAVPLAGCCTSLGLGGDPPPPPPPPDAGVAQAPLVPPGQSAVTVAVTSTPPGAVVTGGGTVLGTTPLTRVVPVPPPTPGQPQSFEFTFQLAGYQPSTITATPVNGTITLNATLAPIAGAPSPDAPVQALAPTAGRMTLTGPGDAIPDLGTARSSIDVPQTCVVGALSVDLVGGHSYFSDLAVSLTAPDGATFSLQRRSRRDPFRTHVVRRAEGHAAQGRWTLVIADQVRADVGMLRRWSMQLECR